MQASGRKSALSHLTIAIYVIGLFWFFAVDAPYLIDVIVFSMIAILATLQSARGTLANKLVGLTMALALLALAVGFVPLAWKESGQPERIRLLRARVEREEGRSAK